MQKMGVALDAPPGLLPRAGNGLHRFSGNRGLVFLLIVATLRATALVGDVRRGHLVTVALMGMTLLLTFRAFQVPGERLAAIVGAPVSDLGRTRSGQGIVAKSLGDERDVGTREETGER